MSSITKPSIITTNDCIEAIVNHFLGRKVKPNTTLTKASLWIEKSVSESNKEVTRIFVNTLSENHVRVVSLKNKITKIAENVLINVDETGEANLLDQTKVEGDIKHDPSMVDNIVGEGKSLVHKITDKVKSLFSGSGSDKTPNEVLGGLDKKRIILQIDEFSKLPWSKEYEDDFPEHTLTVIGIDNVQKCQWSTEITSDYPELLSIEDLHEESDGQIFYTGDMGVSELKATMENLGFTVVLGDGSGKINI